jgi:hypothetical protein
VGRGQGTGNLQTALARSSLSVGCSYLASLRMIIMTPSESNRRERVSTVHTSFRILPTIPMISSSEWTLTIFCSAVTMPSSMAVLWEGGN